jgi:hypothetical protein
VYYCSVPVSKAEGLASDHSTEGWSSLHYLKALLYSGSRGLVAPRVVAPPSCQVLQCLLYSYCTIHHRYDTVPDGHSCRLNHSSCCCFPFKFQSLTLQTPNTKLPSFQSSLSLFMSSHYLGRLYFAHGRTVKLGISQTPTF